MTTSRSAQAPAHPPQQAKAGPLSHDERGAILVPAIVMGAVLVGAMFFVAAVGDAVVFRSQLQDAADVTAFMSAKWHAGGMNIVAVLNILMALVLSLFVLYRVVEILLLALMFVPGAQFAGGALETMVSNEGRVAKGLNVVIELGSAAQMGVSMAVPYLALYHAKTQPTAADTVWPINSSLVPPVLVDNALSRFTELPPREPKLGPAALPIQHDDFSRLCFEAASLWPDQIIQLLKRVIPMDALKSIPLVGGAIADKLFGLIEGTVTVVLSAVIEGTDGAFCQPAEGIASSLLDKALGQTSGTACEAEENQAREEAAETAESESQEDREPPPPPAWTAAEKRECEQRYRDKTQEEHGKTGALATKFETQPAKMWEPAANGNVFMQSWSYVHGKPALFGPDSRGVALAGADGTRAIVPEEGGSAMAEFYFERPGAWSSVNGGFKSTQALATWRPQWTARMRRYRSPGEQLLATATYYPIDKLDELQGQAADFAGETIVDIGFALLNRQTGISVSDDSQAGVFIKEKIQELPFIESLNEKISNAIEARLSDSGLSDLLDRYLDPGQFHDYDEVH